MLKSEWLEIINSISFVSVQDVVKPQYILTKHSQQVYGQLRFGIGGVANMLVPAILYKDEIRKKFMKYAYTDDMINYTGCLEENISQPQSH